MLNTLPSPQQQLQHWEQMFEAFPELDLCADLETGGGVLAGLAHNVATEPGAGFVHLLLVAILELHVPVRDWNS